MKKALVIQGAETIFRKEKGTHSSDEVHEVRFPRLLICVIGGKFLKVSDFSRNAFIKIKYSKHN